MRPSEQFAARPSWQPALATPDRRSEDQHQQADDDQKADEEDDSDSATDEFQHDVPI